MYLYIYICVCVFRLRTPQLYFVKCLEIFGGFSIWRERERENPTNMIVQPAQNAAWIGVEARFFKTP